MDEAFRELMSEIVDYAGFFPPARLELPDAFANYLRYRREEDRWMLGRFICPATRISELAEPLKTVRDPVRLIVIVGETGEVGAVRAALDYRGRVLRVESVEVRVPAEMPFESEAPVRGWMRGILSGLFDGDIEPRTAFFEVPVGHPRLPVAAAAASGLGADHPRAGLKLRLGGADPEHFPEPAALASALSACRDAGVPFKATAGLHHPLRHESEAQNVTMHGFLNVFGGAVLLHRHGLDRETLAELLADEDPGGFRFEGGRIVWHDWTATAEEIRTARGDFATSFGSCSFDEPREDLRALGLL
jgi:hypothetical protein